ncbi:MAG: ferredoxin [Syntrophobacteraceae bacterium]
MHGATIRIPAVDSNLCIGCGNCSEVGPRVFNLNADNKSAAFGGDKCETCNCWMRKISAQSITWS